VEHEQFRASTLVFEAI